MSSLGLLDDELIGLLTPEALEELEAKDPQAFARITAKLEEIEIAESREDYVAFCKYVLRDEQTGGKLSFAEYHFDYLHRIHNATAIVVFGHVEMGKTQLMIGYLLWRIGKNPNIRILFISATATIANRVSSTVRAYIEKSPYLKKVFPHLRPGTPWTDEEWCVVRREGITSPTLRTAGVGSSIISFRFDLIVGDDIVNNDNTQTSYARNKTRVWFESSPMSRTSRDMQMFVTVNKWHTEDAAHKLASLDGWESVTYPVAERLPDGSIKSNWPAIWPVSRIEAELRKRTKSEGDRAFFCKTYGQTDARFEEAWARAALARGVGLVPGAAAATSRIVVPSGWVPVVGVDVGLSEREDADLTSVLFALMRPPPDGFEVTSLEELAEQGIVRGPDMRVMGIVAGRFQTHETFELVASTHFAFIAEDGTKRNPLIFVESVQAQRWLVDIIQRTIPGIQIFPFLTRGRGTRANKNHRVLGVESTFRAIAQGEVALCSGEDGEIDHEIKELIGECIDYSPDAHTGDRLMSMWIAYAGALAYMMDNQFGGAFVEDLLEHGSGAGAETIEERNARVMAEMAARNQEMVREMYEEHLDLEGYDSDVWGVGF